VKQRKGVCRAADLYWGACRLTQGKCTGWQSCRYYETAMGRRWERPAGLQKFFEVGIGSRPRGQAEAGSPGQRPPKTVPGSWFMVQNQELRTRNQKPFLGALITPEPITAKALGQGGFTMTQSESTTRTRRARVDLVEKVQGGYRRASPRKWQQSPRWAATPCSVFNARYAKLFLAR
jgi:hypothetical protein